jgi:hypothetical protein
MERSGRPISHSRRLVVLPASLRGFVWPSASRPLALMLRSIAAHRSTDASTTRLRCDASRSMRACTVAVLILRDARTPIRLCRAVGAPALLRMRTGERMSLNRLPSFNFTMSNSPSRSRSAFLRPGFATLLHSPRIGRWAERRGTFGCVRGTRWGVPSARSHASCDAL